MNREFALKQIEGTGLSMSACREIAVSNIYDLNLSSIKCLTVDSLWTSLGQGRT